MPACFWLEKAAGVKFPGMPPFLLNTSTDTLLKKDFDQYRGKGPHPLMQATGLLCGCGSRPIYGA